MALSQLYEVRALVDQPKLKEQQGVLLFSEADERTARTKYEDLLAEILVGTSTHYDMSRWVGITLTGPNGVFERSLMQRTPFTEASEAP